LQYAKTLFQHPNIDYLQSFGESLPFPDCSFDKVVSISCLEHFQDPLQGLREMARVLKPGGRLALSVDSLLPENSSTSFREWHRRRHFVTQYFNRDELQGMMKEVGLQCDLESTVHLFRSRAAICIRQIFIRNPLLLLPLFPLFYCIVRVADRISDVTHGQIIVVTATRWLFWFLKCFLRLFALSSIFQFKNESEAKQKERLSFPRKGLEFSGRNIFLCHFLFINLLKELLPHLG